MSAAPVSGVVIVGAMRTAIGSFLGQFTGVPTPTLGAVAMRAALGRLEHEGAPLDAHLANPPVRARADLDEIRRLLGLQ